jgi:hypothetical protein
MNTKLDRVYVVLLAALGCATGPGTQDADDATTSTEAGSESPGDGDGDATGTTDATGTGDETGDGDGDGAPPEPFACDNPQPVEQESGNPSGWVQCDNGFKHRVEAIACDVPFDASSCGPDAGCEGGTCMQDFDEGWTCVPGCATDADCADGSVCVCSGVLPGEPSQCVPAGCLIDGECGEGLCGLSIDDGSSAGCDTYYDVGCAGPYDCHSTDECAVDVCPGPNPIEVQFQCLYTGEGFSCSDPVTCVGVCGRPFVVDGEARVAAMSTRTDWCDALSPRDLDSLDSRTRARLADYWAEIGQFEHASIASFARFAMQLLQLGAPPQLLLDTHAAMADEVRHAQRAFGLASAYRGEAVGPGPIDVQAAMPSAADVYEIVESLIVEACVGETLSALEAVEVATHVEDPAIAAVLERIGQDELRHAALGWRSLRWLLDQGDAQLRAFALARLDRAVAELDRSPTAQGLDVALRRYGVVDDELRADVRARGIAELLRPCLAALRGHVGLDTRLAA